MTATMIKLYFFSLAILVIFLANPKGVTSSSSTREPTISASPGGLPDVTTPEISSFFPTPSAIQPMSSGFEAEAPAPAPSSGEFEGKRSSGSARLDCAGAIVGVLLCCALLSSIVVV